MAVRKKRFPRGPIYILSFIVVVLLGWIGFKKLAIPSSINLIGNDVALSPATTLKLGPTAPAGCVYQQVQCIKAPCDPILVCSSTPPSTTTTYKTVPTASPLRVCTDMAGTCLSATGQCVTFTDGCQAATVCAVPIKTCSTSKQPVPTASPLRVCTDMAGTCLSAAGQCVGFTDSCQAATACAQPMQTCGNSRIPVVSAAPTSIPAPSPVQQTPVPSLVPSPTPHYVSQVASFAASGQCGIDDYLSITFTCTNGQTVKFGNGSCDNIVVALHSAQATCGNAAAAGAK